MIKNLLILLVAAAIGAGAVLVPRYVYVHNWKAFIGAGGQSGGLECTYMPLKKSIDHPANKVFSGLFINCNDNAVYPVPRVGI